MAKTRTDQREAGCGSSGCGTSTTRSAARVSGSSSTINTAYSITTTTIPGNNNSNSYHQQQHHTH